MTIRQISIEEFHSELKAQGVPREHLALVCPRCQTVQSATDLIRAGAGDNFDNVERYLGFSCIGRWTGAGSPRRDPDGKPCNWTLGGLFALHTLEVMVDGEAYPRFAPATPEQAQAQMAANLVAAAGSLA